MYYLRNYAPLKYIRSIFARSSREIYFNPKVKKKSILLSCSGTAIYDLLKNLLQPNDKSYDELVKVLSDYFNPKPSTIVERFKLNTENGFVCNIVSRKVVSKSFGI